MEKNHYHHGDLKNSIIDISIGIIQAGGIKELSLRNVAKEIGVSHSAIYRHYISKEDLIVSIAISGFKELSKRLDSASDKVHKDPAQRLAVMCRLYIEYAVDNPVYYRIMFGDYIVNKTEYPDMFRMYDVLFRRLIDTLAECRGKKKKNNADYPVTAISIWSLLHGYSCLVIDNSKDKNVGTKTQINLVIEKLLRLI